LRKLFFDGEQGKIGGEREILLSEREFELFKILLSNKEKFVPVEYLVGWIWGVDAIANTLAALVKRLRKKLPTCMEIASHRGRGYALLCKEVS